MEPSRIKATLNSEPPQNTNRQESRISATCVDALVFGAKCELSELSLQASAVREICAPLTLYKVSTTKNSSNIYDVFELVPSVQFRNSNLSVEIQKWDRER